MRQSDLKLFGDCARQFYYSRVLDLEEPSVGSLTVFGTVWHYAVDVYENFEHDLDLAKRTFEYYWENHRLLGERIDFWHRGSNFQSLLKRGLKMLEGYHELAPWRGGRLLGTEVQFSVPIGNHTLNGTIDKLWARPGQKKIEVIDFKTGALVPEKLRYNVQFSAYCYATTQPEFWQFVPGHEDGWEKYKDYQRAGWWYHARNTKMFNAGFREESDYRRLLLAIDQMDQAIKSDVYPLTITGTACGWCPFAEEICGSEVTL